MKRVHNLKCWGSQFDAVKDGAKLYEIRYNDRDYAVGDELQLWRWDPHLRAADGNRLIVTITSITQARFGLPPALAVLGFVKVDEAGVVPVQLVPQSMRPELAR